MSYNDDIEDLEVRNVYSTLNLFDHLSEHLDKINSKSIVE